MRRSLAWLWRTIGRPLAFRLDPERAHELTMGWLGRLARGKRFRARLRAMLAPNDPELCSERFGLRFPGPVGLAAGFDKGAEWTDLLLAMGFGFIEVGTATLQGQPGNDRARLFRLPKDRVLINRMGFNNPGVERICGNLDGRAEQGVIGINIGRAKLTSNDQAIEEYVACLEAVHERCDYVAVNISSPNTPRLRELQDEQYLVALLERLVARNRELAREADRAPRPLLVKISPDIHDDQLDVVAEVLRGVGVNGVIATNTTVSRSGLRTPARQVEAAGAGGLSGAPLTARSRYVVSRLYGKLGGQIPIVGVGGVMSGEDAWELIRAGASLVQVYTGFIYGGPTFVADLNDYIAAQLHARGQKLDDVVGEGSRQTTIYGSSMVEPTV